MIRRGLRRRDRHGAATVEFAVVASLFFMFVLAVVEFGWSMFAYTLVSNAAREGAHAGALDGAQVSDVTTAVNKYLNGAGLPSVTPTVSPSPPSSAPAGQNVTVTVSIPYTQVSLLPAPSWLTGLTLTATSAMRRETSQ
jgi:Flp pilus assembly protein TadG